MIRGESGMTANVRRFTAGYRPVQNVAGVKEIDVVELCWQAQLPLIIE